MDNLQRMRTLADEINAHNYRYYVLDTPSIADAEYDKLFDALLALERETGVVLPDSPTQRVGGAPIQAFKAHTHRRRLFSLDKCNTYEGLYAFDARVKKVFERPKYSVEYKLDGLTLCLTYKGGELVCAATRGDGETGEDVTAQVKTIRSVPLSIPYAGEIEVQGEGIMRLSALAEYNKTAIEPLKNARNGVAGAIRNLDPAVTASRKLDVVFYHVNYRSDGALSSQSQMLEFLRENRFRTERTFVSERMDEVIDYIGGIQRGALDFLIDGMVVKVEQPDAREVLGYTDRFPKWAIAYKFEAEEATTGLTDVVWNVGRTGKLTPLGLLQPVELCGATVKKATLNNYGDILRKRVKRGGRVFIRRSNDVIPEILGAADENGEEISCPEACPACGGGLTERGAHLFCPNAEACPPQIAGRIEHYASKDCMDLEGLSEKTVAVLCRELDVKSPADLYTLTAAQLQTLDGFRQKKADNLIRAIEASKSAPLWRFIHALGIESVGKVAARDLAGHYKTLPALMAASEEEILTIPNLGEVAASAIVRYLTENRLFIERLTALGVVPYQTGEILDTQKTSEFFDKKIVITGTLEGMGRKDAEQALTLLGARVQSSVSKETDVLIAGENAGSKLAKAQALGVRIMPAAEFFAAIARDGKNS